MKTDPIRNENQEPHRENVDAARRRLLKLAAYSVPALLTVSFLPVEKVLARPNADSPKTPKSPQTPQTPKSPQQPKPTSPPQAAKTPKPTNTPKPTQTPKPTKTLTPQTPKTPTVTPQSSVGGTTTSAGSSNDPNVLQLLLKFLRQLGLLR